MGRIYLPLAWLDEAKIPHDQVAAPENRDKLAILTLRLLNEAGRYYRSGDAGLWHLSFRSACAVAAARQVYSEIGALLVKRGARAWDQRTYVTGARKIWVVLRGVLMLVRSTPARAVPTLVAGRFENRCGNIPMFSKRTKEINMRGLEK